MVRMIIAVVVGLAIAIGGSVLVVNVLSSPQETLARRFADKHEDRFEGIGYHLSPEGLILLDGAGHWVQQEQPEAVNRAGSFHPVATGRSSTGIAIEARTASSRRPT